MKIYLASRYSRLVELCEYKSILEALYAVEVTSRWLLGNHQVDDAGLSQEAKAEERERFAVEDFEDLMAADCVMSFTETPRSTNSRGGRHVEFGMALAAGKRCIVIGPRENVFHCLPNVEWYKDFGEFEKFNNLPQQEGAMSDEKKLTGAELIAAERRRQVEEEGWTPEHDDEHCSQELVRAAASYLLHVAYERVPGMAAPGVWPWEKDWWKPSADPLRNLEKAGALIAAEIDRLQRKEGQP